MQKSGYLKNFSEHLSSVFSFILKKKEHTGFASHHKYSLHNLKEFTIAAYCQQLP